MHLEWVPMELEEKGSHLSAFKFLRAQNINITFCEADFDECTSGGDWEYRILLCGPDRAGRVRGPFSFPFALLISKVLPEHSDQVYGGEKVCVINALCWCGLLHLLFTLDAVSCDLEAGSLGAYFGFTTIRMVRLSKEYNRIYRGTSGSKRSIASTFADAKGVS